MMSSKRTVLVVSPTPPPYSGPEVMTAYLLRSPLKDLYHLVHFNISKGREVGTKGSLDAINLVYGVVQVIQMIWIMQRHRPDLVYTHLAQNLAGFTRYASFVLVARLFRTPVVTRFPGVGFREFYDRCPVVLRWFIRQVLKRIDAVVVLGERLKRQFTGLVPPCQLRVVYNGIDRSEFEVPRSRQDDDQIRVLFVGYLTKAKGALDLLEAVPLVVGRQPNVRFQFMGAKLDIERNITYINNPNSNIAALQDLLRRREVADHVEFLGVQAGLAKAETFRNADLLVLPSYAEAFPTVVLEAMAAGLPVVATPVGVLPEVFDARNLIVVPIGDVRKLAEAIVELARDAKRRQAMGAYNQQVVDRVFDLEAWAGRFHALFTELLEGQHERTVAPASLGASSQG